MRCSRCDHENPASAKFCSECGTLLVGGTGTELARSPESYTPRHLAERILTSRSALEGERKQVTVLFCDIVDSTSLAEALGSEGMHELLNEFFDVALDEIHRYEGTINQFLGDGFMALFGAPIAHEDHSRRAALAALDIRNRVDERRAKNAASGWQGFQLRMGLNSGFLVVGKIGNDLRMDYTAVGDTTNVAARIQSAAAAGEILMSDSARRLVEGYIDFEALPPTMVKGKKEPIELYRVVGVGKRRSPIEMVEGRRLTPFVGRTRDMAVLGEALSRIRPGHGEVVDIEGEPGVGKSRLVHEFQGTLPTDGVSHVVGRCMSYGGSTPYLPILDVLRQYCGIAEADEPKVVAYRLRDVLEETGRSPEADLPYLLRFLGIKEGAEALALLDPATIKGRTFEVLRELFIRRAGQRPLVLTVEDLHWIDASSHEFLAELAPSVAAAAILLVATYRPGFGVPWGEAPHATHMSLRPLSPSHSAAVVNGALQSGSLSEEVTALILDRGEGNPFFLEELARALTERDEQEGIDVVPDTVQGVLAARIDRLPEGDKQLLETASVLGREFPLSLLKEVWEGNGSLPSRLRELVRAEFLYEHGVADEPVYVFKHALTQEVAYESILTGRRQALHRTAAEALEATYAGRLEERCELIAHHYSRSRGTVKAIDFLELANGKAIASHALAEAKGFFSEALELLEGMPDTEENRRRRVVLVLKQFPVFHFLHGHQEYHDLMARHQPIVDSLGDPGLRGSFLGQMGQRVGVFTEFERAREMFTEAAELCDATGNVPGAAHAYVMLEWIDMMTGDYNGAERMRERALERLREVSVPLVYMFCDVGILLAYTYSGRWQDAVRVGQDGFERGNELSDDGIMALCSAYTSLAYVYQGDWDRAIEHAQLALARAPTVYFRGWGQLSLAAALCRSGQLDAGLETLASIVSLILASRHELGYLQFAPLLGDAYISAGEHEKARAIIEDVLERADRCDARFALGSARRLLAELALRTNPEQQEEPLAAPLFERSIDVLGEIGAENELGVALAGYGRLQRRLGDVVSARQLLTQALGIFERLGTMHEPEKVAQELAALPS